MDHLEENLVKVPLTRPQLVYRPGQSGDVGDVRCGEVRSGEDR